MTKRNGTSGREKLLETAGTLFATAGFEGVSTKQLAAGAGLSIGALYHHFPTKEAAYCAALKWGLSRIPAMDRSGLSNDPMTLLEAQVAWFCSVIAASTMESQLLRLELLDPHLDTRLSDIQPFAESFERFQALLAQLAPEADAELMLAAIVSLGFGFSRLGGMRRQVPQFATRLRKPEDIAQMVMRLIFDPRSPQ
jgi:TetR/AcrR family transcriptional regulator